MGSICECPTKDNFQYQKLVIADGKSSADGCWKRWPRELERIAAFFRVKENPGMPDDKNKSYYAVRARGEHALASASKHPNVARIHSELAAEYERRADTPNKETLSLFTKSHKGLDQSVASTAGTEARLVFE